MSLEEERRALTEVVTTIKDGTGQQPKGWLGPALSETLNTPDLLAELGLSYILDWCNDDQPHPMRVKQGRMISVPYSIEVNDIGLFLGTGLTGPQFHQMLVDQFDVLYEDGARTGRVMAVCLHPFIINQPFRHKYLDTALDYITRHENVWVTTSDDIADWYYQHYYAEHQRLLAERRRG
jgi:peptidoglycan/xylan/chitin deacetylase (PgdA/CDA1 family)